MPPLDVGVTRMDTASRMSRRIAIVDDSPELVELLRGILEDDGFDVVTYSGEGDLVTALAHAAPDAIILDLLFPGDSSALQGWDYLRLIRSHKDLHALPVLVCSGDVTGLRTRQGEIAGDPLLESLEKPFSLEGLESALERLIRARPIPAWDDADLVLVANRDGQLVHATPAMLATLGLDDATLRDKRVADIVAEPKSWTEREWRRYLDERHWSGPVNLLTTAGEVLAATANAEVLEGQAGTWHVSRISLVESRLSTLG
jgi:CheY-like chemotaxis protein